MGLGQVFGLLNPVASHFHFQTICEFSSCFVGSHLNFRDPFPASVLNGRPGRLELLRRLAASSPTVAPSTQALPESSSCPFPSSNWTFLPLIAFYPRAGVSRNVRIEQKALSSPRTRVGLVPSRAKLQFCPWLSSSLAPALRARSCLQIIALL